MAFCTNCGAELKPGFRFCTECGAPIAAAPAPEAEPAYTPDFTPDPEPVQESPFNFSEAPQAPDPGPAFEEARPVFEEARPEKPQVEGPLPRKVGFVEAIKRFFTNYAAFHGRASRSEYWWWVLADIIVTTLIGIIAPGSEGSPSTLASIWSLAVLIPGLAIYVRRLHDIGRHWGRIFIILIPIAGPIIAICDMAKASDGDNAWGPCAKTCEECGYYE